MRVPDRAARRPQRDLADGRSQKRSTPSFLPGIKNNGLPFFTARFISCLSTGNRIVPHRYDFDARHLGVRRGTQDFEEARRGERALRPCLCQRRLSRWFSESPKHPIDCPTSFAENREARATPVTSRTLLRPALSPRHRSSLLSFPVHLLARGIRNGEHAAVQRLREPHATTSARRHPPIPSSLSSPSLPPVLCHARRRASQYGRQLVQPSPLFLP